MTPVGFSHSEISGSKPVCDSPELIAANYVLHRHLTPRHPSCALSSLTTNFVLGGLATINCRDTPSQVSIPERTGTPAPGRSCGGSGGCGSRSRSKLVKRATNSGFHRRSFSFSQDTLSRHLVLLNCHRASGSLRPLTQPLSRREAPSAFDVLILRFGGA